MQLLEQGLTKRSFAFYVPHCLAPTLRGGDVLVFEHAVAHRLGEWLATRGGRAVSAALLFPVEQAWSKHKTRLRTAATHTSEALRDALREAIKWASIYSS